MAIITITGGIKSGGGVLAEKLSKKLGYKAIYSEVISECSRKYNILESDLLEELEKLPGLWRRLTGERKRQLIFIKCALLNAAKDDNIIYYGPFGQLFLAGIGNVLKIKLEAPFDKRVKAIMKDMNLSHEKAVDYINDIDKKRSRMIKMLYEKDWLNPSLYDLSVNLHNISLDTVCDMVVTAVGSKEFQKTETTKQILNKISLESEVKAAIASDDKIWNQKITVEASGEKIIVRGLADNKKIRDLIEETVSQVKGVNKSTIYIGLLSDRIHM